jgi:hypothetical protein
MAFQSIPDAAKAAVIGTMAGQLVVTTFNAKKAGGYSLPDLQALADAVATAWSGGVLPFLGAHYTFNRVEAQGLEFENDQEAFSAIGTGVGGNTAAPSPNNACFAVKRRSASTGRGARGRVYLPGLTTTIAPDGVDVDSNWAALMEDGLNAVNAAIAAVDWVEVVIHRVSAGVPLVPAVLFTVVEYVAVDLAIDSMRRRLKGRGQ